MHHDNTQHTVHPPTTQLRAHDSRVPRTQRVSAITRLHAEWSSRRAGIPATAILLLSRRRRGWVLGELLHANHRHRLLSLDEHLLDSLRTLPVGHAALELHLLLGVVPVNQRV